MLKSSAECATKMCNDAPLMGRAPHEKALEPRQEINRNPIKSFKPKYEFESFVF